MQVLERNDGTAGVVRIEGIPGVEIRAGTVDPECDRGVGATDAERVGGVGATDAERVSPRQENGEAVLAMKDEKKWATPHES